jgi:tetratricopeptide (TPR) repeat protein
LERDLPDQDEQEEDEGVDQDLWDPQTIKRAIAGDDLTRALSKRVKRSHRKIDYSAQQKTLLGEAHELYISGSFQPAIDRLLQVIQQQPKLPEAFESLAMAYDALGFRDKLLHARLVACHLNSKSAADWKFCAQLAEELNQMDVALYCWSRLASMRSCEEHYTMGHFARIRIFLEDKDDRAVVLELQRFARKKPKDLKTVMEICRLFSLSNCEEESIGLLKSTWLRLQETQSDSMFPSGLVKLICMLFIRKKRYDEGFACIRQVPWLRFYVF